ncbi:MAG: tRNA pseudouridine(38-40) synthase TruA [Chloroflexota bacterium]
MDALEGVKQGTRESVPVRYRARVEYDGTEFSGFQSQPGARTVQGALEAALATLSGGIRFPVDGAGRTDAGVHATGQVISFIYTGRLQATELTGALNGLLPPDVAIRDLRKAPLGFHPRHAARYREYRYTVWNGPRSPIRARTALWMRNRLDTDAMARAAQAFVGRHDFSAFGGADPQPIRNVHHVRVRRDGNLITIDIRANAFLRGMVRRIVAALIGVGRGTISESGVVAALAERRPAFGGVAAPAQGLSLRRVVYGRSPVRTSGEQRER